MLYTNPHLSQFPVHERKTSSRSYDATFKAGRLAVIDNAHSATQYSSLVSCVPTWTLLDVNTNRRSLKCLCSFHFFPLFLSGILSQWLSSVFVPCGGSDFPLEQFPFLTSRHFSHFSSSSLPSPSPSILDHLIPVPSLSLPPSANHVFFFRLPHRCVQFTLEQTRF